MKYTDEKIEAIVLSAILNGHSDLLDELTDDDITVGTYKNILQACRKVKEEGQDVDIVTVGIKTGKGSIVSQISAEYFKGINYKGYTTILKNLTAKRRIYQGLHYIQEQLNMDNPADIKANILDYFSEIPLAGQTQDDSIRSVMLKTHEHLEYKYKHRNDTSNHTGISDLDKHTGGLHRGEVTIIAARPSVGKTALAIQIALQVAKKEKIVQVFSREMSQVQLGTRMIANQGKVDGQKMRTGHIRDDDWIDIVHASGYLSSLPLYINDESSTMPDIRAVCAEKKHKGLDLVIIDYMQLIEPHKRSDTREREVAEISRAIKKMTVEFDIPIIALSQLNRSTANKRPTLDTLRESGAIEQDADNVIFLHKPDEKDVEPEDKTTYREIRASNRDFLEVILAKQRNGPTGIFSIAYNPRYIRFETIYKGV